MKPPLYLPGSQEPAPNPFLRDLTTREWSVLLQIANDFTNAEIAERLSIEPKSVETYRTRIGSKLDLTGCGVLARFARRYAGELRQWYELLTGNLPPRRANQLIINNLTDNFLSIGMFFLPTRK